MKKKMDKKKKKMMIMKEREREREREIMNHNLLNFEVRKNLKIKNLFTNETVRMQNIVF